MTRCAVSPPVISRFESGQALLRLAFTYASVQVAAEARLAYADDVSQSAAGADADGLPERPKARHSPWNLSMQSPFD